MSKIAKAGWKEQLLQTAMTSLFVAEERRLVQAIDNLIDQNRERSGGKYSDRYCMTIDGKMYVHSRYQVSKGAGVIQSMMMHSSIRREVEAFSRDKARVAEDRRMIKQMLHTCVQHCSNQQELLDTIPEELVTHTGIRWERRYAEMFLAPKDERFIRQWAQVKELIAFYSAVALIY